MLLWGEKIMFALLLSFFPLSESQWMLWRIYIDAASWFCFLCLCLPRVKSMVMKESGLKIALCHGTTPLSSLSLSPSVSLPHCELVMKERFPTCMHLSPPFTPISASIQGSLPCTAVALLTLAEYTAGDELPVQTRALRMWLQICNTITAQQMKRALMERMTNITISVARGRPALRGFASLMCAQRGRWFGGSGKRKWQGLKFYYQCLLCKRWHRAYAFPLQIHFPRLPESLA